ncbi:hypothetical protein POX_d06073 [Penicillium oxalicum]|uniref:Uncharacterized protein n=1 Tax=Penicillium oxalicum (strain 114-2 / CGMCC 5302) TaxID=933388 RepID=S7ZN15_PENO1|nr:hypothetical protein POX_d06073 [Penicillium oxalicum]EPS31734.1 hypothetical protein PDE_06691 [Penicillium oxalicum 114-2]KAI2790553.1 hypothetical protein POX_d06073 [Penicillium oxalicum]
MGQVTEGAGKKREGQESSEKTPAKSAVPVAFAANFAQATNTDNATPGEETGIADQAVNSLRQEEFSSGIRERRKCDKVKRSAKIGQGPVPNGPPTVETGKRLRRNGGVEDEEEYERMGENRARREDWKI